MKHARHNLNTLFHGIGIAMLAFGIVMGVKAAGIADLGGDFTEMVACCKCAAVAVLGSAFFANWNI